MSRADAELKPRCASAAVPIFCLNSFIEPHHNESLRYRCSTTAPEFEHPVRPKRQIHHAYIEYLSSLQPGRIPSRVLATRLSSPHFPTNSSGRSVPERVYRVPGARFSYLAGVKISRERHSCQSNRALPLLRVQTFSPTTLCMAEIGAFLERKCDS